LENLEIDEKKYYNGSSRNGLEGMEWIVSDSFLAFVNAV
jgi:hypothetical protein